MKGQADARSVEQTWGVGRIESIRKISDTFSIEHHNAMGFRGVQTIARFANASRNHWGIENGLHWTLDVVFREEHCHVRKGHAARNFSVLRKFPLATLRQEEEAKMGLHRRRVHTDRHPEYRECLIRRAFAQNGSEDNHAICVSDCPVPDKFSE